MSTCNRINANCDNKRMIICDTNFIINYLNYIISRNRTIGYRALLNKLNDFLDLICYCGINNTIYCSGKVFNEEYCGTIFRKVHKFQQLDRMAKDTIKQGIESHLTLSDVSDDSIQHLKVFSDDFTSSKRISPVHEPDLSLLIVALEKLKDNQSTKFLIITDDDSFYDFINYVKQMTSLTLGTTNFNKFNVIPITSTTFLTLVFRCCKFNELQEYEKFRVVSQQRIGDANIISGKYKKFADWVFNDYTSALLIKQENSGVGICGS